MTRTRSAPLTRPNGRRAIRFNDTTREWEFWSVADQAWHFLTARVSDVAIVKLAAGRSIYGCDPVDVLVLSYKFTKDDQRIESDP